MFKVSLFKSTLMLVLLNNGGLLSCSSGGPDQVVLQEDSLSSATSPKTRATEESRKILPGEDEILVSVNGDKISQFDLTLIAEKTLGSAQASVLSKAAEKKILESLVISHVMSMAQETKLNNEQKSRLDKEVSAYREQLLVKQYIAENILPEPVTQEMVNNYYQNHREKFGGKNIQNYEMVSTLRELPPQARDELVTVLNTLREKKAWRNTVKQLTNRGYPVKFNRSVVEKNSLHPILLAAIAGLNIGETSNVSFIDGKPYLIRLLSEQSQAAKPLAEVASDIRKSLVPLQLRKVIKQLADELLAQADVRYIRH